MIELSIKKNRKSPNYSNGAVSNQLTMLEGIIGGFSETVDV